ncbi:MAG: hypothetical protein ACD_16C00007G0004 [uncultured bacterium]|nr:MAG: hypothetical protein ACD_16C00007G0004 [uncultured bacterium]OFX00669.1 MAG: hypothetical protein A2W62_01355 [Alphaproteobacteria bacterium RIFCSPLOWO2_02_42_7]
MQDTSILDENWNTLLSLLPKHWEELAVSTGAMTRKMRSFDSAGAILRTLLLHIARGYSLRETVVRAKAAGIASVSDVALLKRLRSAEDWLKSLCCSLLEERGVKFSQEKHRFNIRLVDGTVIREPGKTGSQWRIHYSLSLPSFRCDYFELTPTKGKATAENLQRIPVSANDCLIADRAFSTAADIHYLHISGAYILVRVNTGGLPIFKDNKASKRFDLLKAVQTLKNTGNIGEWPVYVKAPKEDTVIRGRLCVVRKSEQAIEDSLKKLRQEASKRQSVMHLQTLEYGKYVIIFTTLPKKSFAAHEVLEWYRIRWQIELVFKRFKSLAKLGHLPKYDEESSRAWLYGKLFVCLLTEKSVNYSKAISPWGYSLSYNKDT